MILKHKGTRHVILKAKVAHGESAGRGGFLVYGAAQSVRY